MNDIKDIARIGWIKRWAGSYTFISCAYWGYQYYEQLRKVLDIGFDHTLFTHKKGVVSFYLPYSEFEHFGKAMAERTTANHHLAKQWLQELKNNTDKITPLMKKLGTTVPTWDEYQEFLIYFERHLPYHNFMKKTVDFLPPGVLSELLPFFKEARLYSENVYSDTESFFRSVAKQIAKKERRNPEYLTCLTKEEFERYLTTLQLPDESILTERYESSALYFADNKQTIYSGQVIDELEQAIADERTKDNARIKGMIGYKGKVEGIARIILDPFNVSQFNEGDILVTGMTRPEFMPVIQKSAAIVTDAGGVLCHAAIVARELHKPCIVGTEIATKVIKDGEKILVDAEAGIVEKLH